MYDGDPLGALVMSSRDLDRERVRDLLAGKVWLDPQEGAIRFAPGVRERLKHPEVVLLALLGQMALHLLEAEQSDGLTPGEVSEVTGIKGGSARPVLKRLTDDGVILKNGDGRYVVPPTGLDHVELMLGGTDE